MTLDRADTPLTPEDEARAFCYAVASGLFYGPPDERLRSVLMDRRWADGGSRLADAWSGLQDATRGVTVDAARSEYDDLFIGVGKAPVTLYTGAYVTNQAPDRHLLALRTRLAQLNLTRAATATESEDHVSAVCDAMRWLIENRAGEAAERDFFFEFVAPVSALCGAIDESQNAVFYRAVSGFTLALLEVERAAFDLTEAG